MTAPDVQLVPSVADDMQVVAVPLWSGCRPAGRASVLVDPGALQRLGFDGKPGESLLVTQAEGPAVLALGLGKPAELTVDRLRKAAAAAARAAWKVERLTLTLLDAAGEDGSTVSPPQAAQAVVEGALLATYRFTRYRSEPDGCRIERIDVVGKGPAVHRAVERGRTVAAAVTLARDLVNEPPGSMTPARLAEVATEVAAERDGLECTVFDEKAIAREKLGGLAGVAQGSAQPPRLVKLVWEPARPRATVAIVGKGITFDSGGLSLKTAQGMMTMKADMTGAAVVVAVMSALPALKPPLRVIGYAPATENLPGGRAIKPSDVLRIRSGKTVEVLNTDAEGRLVLADALSLAVEDEPDAIVDLATLTGACVVALGKRVAGLFGTDSGLLDEVRSAGERAGEPAWPLPMPDEYRKDIESKVADIKNIGDSAGGGAIAAAMFLREFVDDIPWAHLDIAGPAWSDGDDGYLSAGGTAFGVRTVLELLSNGNVTRRPRTRRAQRTPAS